MKMEDPELRYRPLVKLISQKLGIGELTISKTIAEFKATGDVSSPNKRKIRCNVLEKTSESDILAIRRKVHEFWLNKEIPNVRKILTRVNENANLPPFTYSSLSRKLKRMEFKYIVRGRNSAMIDKEYIVSWRQEYVYAIDNYRSEGRPIYYLDETWVNAGDVRRKLWVDTSVTSPKNAAERGLTTGIPPPANKGKRLIVAHIGSTDGFVPEGLLYFESKKNTADYHDEMNGDTFFDWFITLMPMLRDGAVIVMDNAPYHSVKVEKYPNMSWKKNDIISWLVGKGETVQPHYVKAQLLDLMRKYKRENNYVIDEYAKLHGHEVLRLPPYHCELNPIELAWASVKDYVRARNTTYKLSDVQTLLHEAIENVSAESWQNFIRHTIKEEDRVRQLDNITDTILDEGEEWEHPSESDSDINSDIDSNV
ncbi:uncharacterized protein LOC123988610 [Osmia bicornis bicornis]|uniref:uncharacterized protein LOC123988610 n=1 Tax=Osmia bicornis bicornis TaxID=1437191 RepID=UPI001EAF81C7|nr:uncharacterized protein LOC123988610 [Osmia bicornis bicornis]